VELVQIVVLYVIAKYVILPCIIGTAVYYSVIKTIVGVHWLMMGKERRDLERRRNEIRVRDW
jgi:hypothetical protein